MAVSLMMIGSGTLARAQQQTTEAELLRVTEKLYQSALATRTAVSPPRLLGNASWMRDSVRSPVFWSGPVTSASAVSPEYLRSLEIAAAILERQPNAQILADIAEDLEAKVQHCRALRIGMGGTVRLRVNTRRGNDNIGNLQVQYLLKFYEAVAGSQPLTFPRLSSPTESPLEPGRYWIWAVDPVTGRTGSRTLVRVSGQRELIVDLPAP